MENGIFREKSIERVSSPEQLNSYIKVCTPTLWVVLSAVILLLCGVIVWSLFGELDTTVNAVAVADNDNITLYVKTEDLESIKGKTITIDEEEYTVDKITYSTAPDKYELTEYELEKGDLKEGEYVFKVIIDAKLPKGVYQARIITDSVSPISFVIN